jgi:membrane protein YdbS with pleckstrin-like domain
MDDPNAWPPAPQSDGPETGPQQEPSALRRLTPRPDESAPADDSEQTLWTGRTHWKHYAGRIGLWLAGCVVYAVLVGWVAAKIEALSGAAAWYLGAIPILLSGGYFGGRLMLRIAACRYRLTDQRLFIDRGIMSRTIDQTELIRVDDVRIRKSLVDQIVGLGSVEVLSTDVSDGVIVIEGIAGADHVAETIRSRMRALRRQSLFVENL